VYLVGISDVLNLRWANCISTAIIWTSYKRQWNNNWKNICDRWNSNKNACIHEVS